MTFAQWGLSVLTATGIRHPKQNCCMNQRIHLQDHFRRCFIFPGHHYLVFGDCLYGWSDIFATATGTMRSGAWRLVSCLRKFFSIFSVLVKISSDRDPEFESNVTADFLRKWSVGHRISSAYHPRSNERAKVAVKSAKRLLRSNIDSSGRLDNDRFLGAML